MKTKKLLVLTGVFCIGMASIRAQNTSFDQNWVPLFNGNFNAAFGQQALFQNQFGNENTGIGQNALFQNSSGNGNTATGFRALSTNLTGNNNTTIGYLADVASTGLNNATAIGANAVVTTNNSIQLGDGLVTQIFGGIGNTATFITGGLQVTGGTPSTGMVLTSNATGVATWQSLPNSWSQLGNAGTNSSTNFIGTTDNVNLNFRVNNVKAGSIELNGAINTSFGYGALLNSVPNNNLPGGTSYSSAFGYQALYNSTTGYKNNAFGRKALYSLTTGMNNCGFGHNTMEFLTSGDANNSFGNNSLGQLTNGFANNSFGQGSLYSLTTGVQNCAFGTNALSVNNGYCSSSFGGNSLQSSTGSYNSAFGYLTFAYNSTGSYNTGIGLFGLYYNTTGDYNTGLGANSDVSLGNFTNATAIGSGAIANASNKVVIGNTASGMVIGGYASAGWSTLSDGRFKENVKEEVAGLDFILKLRPVSYTINTKKLDQHLMQNMSDSVKAARMKSPENYENNSKIVSTGFIAQEVEKTVTELGINFDGVNAPKNVTDNYSIGYAKFVVPLVKGMQEQQKMIESQQQQIDALKALVNSMAGTITGNKLGTTSSVPVNLSDKNAVVLNQNVPNPFAESTSISYFIPNDFTIAQLVFTSLDGKVIKSVDILSSGAGSVTVFANDLSNGVYSYALVVDGKTLDTKKMIKQ